MKYYLMLLALIMLSFDQISWHSGRQLASEDSLTQEDLPEVSEMIGPPAERPQDLVVDLPEPVLAQTEIEEDSADQNPKTDCVGCQQEDRIAALEKQLQELMADKEDVVAQVTPYDYNNYFTMQMQMMQLMMMSMLSNSFFSITNPLNSSYNNTPNFGVGIYGNYTPNSNIYAPFYYHTPNYQSYSSDVTGNWLGEMPATDSYQQNYNPYTRQGSFSIYPEALDLSNATSARHPSATTDSAISENATTSLR